MVGLAVRREAESSGQRGLRNAQFAAAGAVRSHVFQRLCRNARLLLVAGGTAHGPVAGRESHDRLD